MTDLSPLAAINAWIARPEEDAPLEDFLADGLTRLLGETTGQRTLLVIPSAEGEPALEVGRDTAGQPCALADFPADALRIPLPGLADAFLLWQGAAPAQRDLLETFAALAALWYEKHRWQAAYRRARQEKSHFVSVVSHELRLPMTSIKGYTDLMLKGMTGAVNDMQTNFLGVIRNNVERMSRLISDLSDLSKAEDNRLPLQIEAFPVNMAIQQALAAVEEIAAGRKQTIRRDVPTDLPAISADPARAAQMIAIYLRNALLYSPEGSEIIVRASQNEAQVRVEVQDPGMGVAEADQQHLFEPFFRSEDQRVRDHAGWGLGLAVVQALARLQGGFTGFVPPPQAGSIFWVTFPLA
ncbi:MAG: hypothetical protein Fur0018_00970 [Anaerolineales bacterium]